MMHYLKKRKEKGKYIGISTGIGKRFLSMLIVFFMAFSLMLTEPFLFRADAAGLSSVTYTKRSDGGIEVTCIVTPVVINGSVGSAQPDILAMISEDGNYYDQKDANSWTRLTGPENCRDVTSWKGIFYPPEDGTWTFAVRSADSTSGVTRYFSSYQVTFDGLLYDRNNTSRPGISLRSVNPSETDKSKVNAYGVLWRGGGRRVTDVSWWRGDADGNNPVLVYSEPVPTANKAYYYTYSGLSSGTTYTFWATATSPNGTTTTAKLKATPGSPGAPQNFRAIPGNNSVIYTWDEPAVIPDGVTITGYNIYWNYATTPSNGSTPISATSRTATRTVTNGTEAYGIVYVAAVTSDGIEGARAEVGEIWAGTPKPVAAPTVTKSGGRNLYVSWTAPDNNGDTTAITYNVLAGSTSLGTTTATSGTFAWPTSMDKTTQSIKIQATNSRGTGPVYYYTNVTLNGVTEAPTIGTVKGNGSTGQLVVNWTTPSNFWGGTPSEYIIYNADTGDKLKTVSQAETPTEWTANMTTTSKAVSTTLTGLKDGTTYNIQVAAVNTYGTSAKSGKASGSPYSKPSAPSSLTATGGNGKITLSWGAATKNGADITAYKVYEVINGAVQSEPVKSVGNVTTTDIESLDINSTHTYVVKATNAAGEGDASAQATATTHDKPGTAGDIKVIPSGASTATVEWTVPSYDGRTSITQYRVNYTYVKAGNSGTAGRNGSQTVNAGQLAEGPSGTGWLQMPITGLTRGATYTFTVTAINEVGEGEASDSKTARTWDQPSEPLNVTAEAGTDESGNPLSGNVKVTWQKPQDHYGSDIEYYTVHVYEAEGSGAGADIGDENTGLTRTIAVDELAKSGDYYSYNVTGLVNGGSYFFRVSAENGVDESAESEAVFAMPVYYPGRTPDVAASVEDVEDDETIKVTWGHAQPNNGDVVTAYQVLLYDRLGALITKEENRNSTTEGVYDVDIYTTDNYGTIKITYTSDNSATVTGLAAGTLYQAGVLAYNSLGADKTGGIGKSNTVTTLDVPDAPININATPTHTTGEILITWDDPEDFGRTPIISYTIKVYEKDSEEVFQTYTPAVADLTDGRVLKVTGLDDSKVYEITISATNKIGPGAESERKEAKSNRSPNAAEDVEARIQSGAESMVVTWKDPSDNEITGARGDGGSAITEYRVYIYKSVGGERTSVAQDVEISGATLSEDGLYYTVTKNSAATVQTATITGLERGVTYVADIRPVNEAGESEYKAETGNVTMWTLPSMAQYPTAGPTNVSGELKITWRAPEINGDAIDNDENNHTSITDYKIYYRIRENITFTEAEWDGAEADANGIYSQVIDGLSNGSRYEVYVTAVNDAGESEYVEGETYLAAGVPRGPAEMPSIAGVESGNSSAVLKLLMAPKTTNGSEVVYYNIYATELDVVTDKILGEAVLKKSTSYVEKEMEDITIPNLENGKKYAITVTAVNGTEIESEPSNAETILVGKPLAPQNVKVEPGERFTAVATFDPAVGNGSAIQYYLAYVDGELYTDEDGNAVQFPDKPVIVEASKGGAAMVIQISAVNRVGESEKSAAKSIVIGAPTTPSIEEMTTGAEGIDLKWTSVNDNGISMKGYNIYVKKGEADWAKVVTTEATETERLVTIEEAGLEPGIEYQVKVTAENLVGESPDSNIMSFRFGVPSAPEVSEVKFGDGTLTVYFTEPTDTGVGSGEAETGTLELYTVYANGIEKVSDVPGASTFTQEEDGRFSVVLTGLANGSNYQIQMTAHNEYGESPMSAGVSQTPATVPDAPRSVVAEATSDTTVTLTWKAPLYNGGAPITEYTVAVYKANEDGTEGYSQVTDAEITFGENDELKAEISSLERGKEYYFTVKGVNKAVNEENEGKEGRSVVTKTFTKPDAPVITSWRSYYNTGNGLYNLEINWRAPEYTGETPITGYRVWTGRSDQSGFIPADRTSHTITGLSGQSVTVRVEAFNMICNTVASQYGAGTYAEVVADVGKIAAPEIESVSTTQDEITITWKAVDDEFSYYKVYDLGTEMMKQHFTTVEEAVDYVEKTWQGNVAGSTVDPDVTSITFTNRDKGTHYYAIRCFTNQGLGGYLSEVVEVTLGGASAPTLNDVVAGYEGIDISFNALEESQLNELPLYGYQIMLNGAPYTGTATMDGKELEVDSEQGAIIDAALVSATGEINLHLPGITGNKEYTVAVRGVTVNDILEAFLPGLLSGNKTVTVWTNPTAPVLLDTVGGDGKFDVRFRPSDGMGLPIAGYAVFFENNGEDGMTTPFKEVPIAELGSDMTIEVTGVENGYKDTEEKSGWQYYVAAYTEKDGERWYSAAPADPLTIVTGIPGAPEITDVRVGNTTVTISYTEPPMDASIAVQKYIITYGAEGVSYETTESYENTCVLSQLINGRPYTITVQAVNSVGEGLVSKEVILTPGTPGSPEILDYAAGNEQITVRWKAPADNDMPLKGYTVYYTDTRDNSTYREEVDVNLNSIVLANSNIENGVNYKIVITATNGNGEGQPSEELVLMPGTIPGEPTEARAAVLGGDSIQLSWLEPADNGGLSVDYYAITGSGVVEQANAQGYVAADANYVFDEEAGLRRYTVTIKGLDAGTSYKFGVKAHNQRDFGAVAESNEVKTYTVPGRPEWKKLNSVNYTFTAKWTKPEDDGGTDIYGYNVYVDGVPVSSEPIIPDVDESLYIDENGDFNYTAPNPLPDGRALELGATYEVSISAVNSVGESAETSRMEIEIQGQAAESVPGKPGTPTVTRGNSQLTVSWTAPTIEGVIEGIEGYYVYYRVKAEEGAEENEATSIWHTKSDLKTVITGLVNDTTYEVWVVAKNRIGTSALSAKAEGTPEEITAPNKPTNMKYQNNAQMTTMTISWDEAVASEDGGTVYYDVYINDPAGNPLTTTSTNYQLGVENGIRYNIWIVARNDGGSSELDSSTPDLIAANWLNVETTGVIGAEPNLNLDRDYDGVLDPDQVATKPTAPTDLNASIVGVSRIDLSWRVPVKESYDGEDVPFTDIISYTVHVNGEEYATFEVEEPATSVESREEISFTDVLEDGTNGLIPGTIYSFQVSAKNLQGDSEMSIPLQVYVQDSIDPTNLTAVLGEGENKYTSAYLSWDAPTTSSDRTPSRYWIQINGEDKINVEPTLTEYELNGLMPNTNYVFRVWAQYDIVSESGETVYDNSKTTNAVNLSTKLAAPTAPQSLEAVNNGNYTIDLSWNEPTTDEFDYYYLYVDGNLLVEEDGETPVKIEKGEVTYTYDAGGVEGDFAFSLSAVNEVTATVYVDQATEDVIYTKEGAKSNTATASTRDIPEEAPKAPDGLLLTAVDGKDITFTWNRVTQRVDERYIDSTLAENEQLTYVIYVSKDGSAFGDIESDMGVGYQDNIQQGEDGMTLSYTYSEGAASDGHDYMFRVQAVIQTVEEADGETTVTDELYGAMSEPFTVSTKADIPLPEAPTGLLASVNESKTAITISWDPTDDGSVYGYYIYVDAVRVGEVMAGDEGFDLTAPSYTYTIEEGSTKSSFYFQVAAVNDSAETNSADEQGVSEPSTGIGVTLGGQITELPPAAAAPVIVKSIHDEMANVIRIFWNEPTEDVEGNALSRDNITGYQIKIATENSDGTTSNNFELAEKFRDEAYFDAESGQWYYDIDIAGAYPIEMGTKYKVTISAWRNFTVDGESFEVPGAFSDWSIMRNLNLDEDGDGEVDVDPDTDGDGSPDPVEGTEVTLTGIVTGGSADLALDIKIVDNASAEITPDKVTYDATTGDLKVVYRVNAGSADAATGTYTVTIKKAGTTKYEMINIPMITTVKKIDIGSVALVVGDADGDGIIDGNDLAAVRVNLNGPGETIKGDVDGSGYIDGNDLAAVRVNLNTVSTPVEWKGV